MPASSACFEPAASTTWNGSFDAIVTCFVLSASKTRTRVVGALPIVVPV